MSYSRPARYIVLIVLAVLFHGCATGSSVSLSRANAAVNGIVAGKIVPQGDSVKRWQFESVYVQNAESGSKHILKWQGHYFCAELPPGEYKLFLGGINSPGYYEGSSVKVNTHSTSFSVNAGEVTYIGDIIVTLIGTTAPVDKQVTWIPFVGTITEYGVGIKFHINDRKENTERFMANSFLPAGFTYTTELISFPRKAAA